MENFNDLLFNNASAASDLVFDHNLTLITSQKNWPVLSLSLLGIVGTIGNVLVCVSITLDKQLQTVTNWFLFSLSIADCLVSVIVVPLAIAKDFVGKSNK
ncbi:unnamed protein product [Didymodactylos carnosus]|uniref:G-protein coupled receptors family 1 profile domain-containing protein n=1 Tax=Didymodactylos carnosus TaxID=1234261 RepID=A0A815ILI3_9BILA|nr:unnamed protein product [Didymodactylos carnosus]CAF4250103.1 unnamed protein product [Didymodactylos carnosus]